MYRANMPSHCPGDQCFEEATTLLRAYKSNPPKAEDFTPHCESKLAWKLKKSDPNNCQHWGLSVWTDETKLLHARETDIAPWMKRFYIFKCTVLENEGRINTPSGSGHRTYWPYTKTDLLDRAELVLPPVGN